MVEIDATYCPACGSAIVRPKAAAPHLVGTPSLAAPAVWPCPRCNSSIPSISVYCPACGLRLVARASRRIKVPTFTLRRIGAIALVATAVAVVIVMQLNSPEQHYRDLWNTVRERTRQAIQHRIEYESVPKTDAWADVRVNRYLEFELDLLGLQNELTAASAQTYPSDDVECARRLRDAGLQLTAPLMIGGPLNGPFYELEDFNSRVDIVTGTLASC